MKRFWITSAAVLAASPVAAHHPLAGAPMESFWHGLASGVGHPVLGFDHLFFVISVGLAAGLMQRAAIAPLAYVAAMIIGCAGIGARMPAQEAVIALSLVVMGAVVVTGRVHMAPMLFAVFGLFHGAAFASALGGVEVAAAGPVTAGYLIGLAAVQWAIAFAVAGLVGRPQAAAIGGAMVAGVGVFLALELVEGPLLGVLTG